MVSEMKEIMDRWNGFLITEAPQITTVGELRKVIAAFRALETGKRAAAQSAEQVLQQIPGVSNIYNIVKGAKDAREMFRTLYGLDDKFKTQTGLDKLNVDDNISQIVDDKVEAAFLNHLLQKVSGLGEYDEVPDVAEEMQQFLMKKFDQHAVKK